MNFGAFDASAWIDRLAPALAALAEAQEGYLDEVAWRRDGSHRAAPGLQPEQPHEFTDDLVRLYRDAEFGKGSVRERHYDPIRTALIRVREGLSEHPALAPAAESGDGLDNFTIVLPDRAGSASALAVAAGLTVRAAEHSGGGFGKACREWHSLFAGGGERGSGELGLGYHVALFQGLRLREKVRVSDDMAIVPFARIGAFVDKGIFDLIAPRIALHGNWQSIAAVVKPFRWKPEARPWTEEIELLDLDWGGSFREDAEVLIELLALAHGAPIVCLATIHYCIDRIACCLLGQQHFHGSWTLGRSARTFDASAGSCEASGSAMEEAWRMFGKRDDVSFSRYRPVIGRLAEALARNGRFAAEDRILDVAIALERIYEVDRGEIAFKLRMRAAYFLELDRNGRWQVFDEAGKLYRARSAIVHNARQSAASRRRQEAAFKMGADLARRSIVKLSLDGPPSDWNEMVNKETEAGRHKPRNGAGTTTPGYRNRNGQVVVQKTDVPGNDHNQLVYVLRCSDCGLRYGANGSDIWQRTCPGCGGGRLGLKY